MHPPHRLRVREMQLEEIDHRISYFHGAPDEYLTLLGVDRSLLMEPDEWRASYALDLTRPMDEKQSYSIVWELDERIIGFSSTDRIVYGREAFMHLHLVDPPLRSRGLGARFIRLSAQHYVEALALEHLFSEPNACNVPPNRALMRAGFGYQYSHFTTPGPYNVPQVVTRWALSASVVEAFDASDLSVWAES